MRVTIASAIALSAMGCGSARPPPAEAQSTQAAPASVSGAHRADGPPDSPATRLSRRAVHEVIQNGLGSFLQRLDVDDHPVFTGGKFKGFRIVALRGDAFWSGVDLRPGDVVLRVNGLPIERPEQAEAAFEALDAATELRVDYERDGQPRALVYPIEGGR